MTTNNSDGFGFAYYENGKVKVEKGWFDFEKCYARIKELDETIGFIEDLTIPSPRNNIPKLNKKWPK